MHQSTEAQDCMEEKKMAEGMLNTNFVTRTEEQLKEYMKIEVTKNQALGGDCSILKTGSKLFFETMQKVNKINMLQIFVPAASPVTR